MNQTGVDSSVEQDLPQADSERSSGRVRVRQTTTTPQSRQKRRRTSVGSSFDKVVLPYKSLLIQNGDLYDSCTNFYRVLACTKFDGNCTKGNDYPYIDRPADICLMSCIPLRKINCFEPPHTSPDCDWGSRSVPVISRGLIKHFLGVAHQFTTLGLEMQATAFSCGDDGAVNYLAFLPQINTLSQVTDRD